MRAFQYSAFQNNAFQMGDEPGPGESPRIVLFTANVGMLMARVFILMWMGDSLCL
jgi:hypothetical protein